MAYKMNDAIDWFIAWREVVVELSYEMKDCYWDDYR